MDSKICVICNIGKRLIIFATNIENENNVMYNEVFNVTMRMKINYQINEKYIMIKTEI